MSTPEKSFQLDKGARSFRVSNFTLRDLGLLALAFIALTLFSLLIGWLPAHFLPEKWLNLYAGFIAGFACGVLICSRFRRRAQAPDVQGPPAQSEFPPEKRHEAKTESRTGLTLIELLVVTVIIVVLLALILPESGKPSIRGRQTRALSNAKQIGLACRVFAMDHDGHFPSGGVNEKGEVVPGAPTSSNAVLAQLLPDYLPEKNIFLLPQYPAYCSPAAPDDKATELGAGENHWGYVSNLLDEKSNPRFPLIADGAVTGGTAYSRKEGSPGSRWKGLKAIVVRVDLSAAIETLNEKTLTISDKESGMVDILQSGQPGWLDKTQVFLNPIPRP